MKLINLKTNAFVLYSAWSQNVLAVGSLRQLKTKGKKIPYPCNIARNREGIVAPIWDNRKYLQLPEL